MSTLREQIGHVISAVCQDLLPTIRHFENRPGEGPGDEVEYSSHLAHAQTKCPSVQGKVIQCHVSVGSKRCEHRKANNANLVLCIDAKNN